METFKRVEIKYLLTEEEYHTFLAKIKSYIKKDKYAKSTICNIYFDTEKDDLLLTSLEKPLYKEKIRLRSYNVPDLKGDVFLEIKKKYKGVVSKRRVKLSLMDFLNYLNKGIKPVDSFVFKELDYRFSYYKLVPKMFIAYDRICFVGIEDNLLRITFDRNLRSRSDNLDLKLGDAGKLYFTTSTYIMEIKTLGAMPLWLSKVLTELKIYPTSFSKYGMIYQKNKKEERKIYV